MAQFVFTANRNIQDSHSNLDLGRVKQHDSRIINIGFDGVTSTNLFSQNRFRDVLARQLNKEFGVEVFTKENIQQYGTSFRIKPL